MDIKVISKHSKQVKQGIIYKLYVSKDNIVLEQQYGKEIKQLSILPQNIKKGIPNKNCTTRISFKWRAEGKYIKADIPIKIMKYIRIPNRIYTGDKVLYKYNEYYAKPKGTKYKLYKNLEDLIYKRSYDCITSLKHISLMKPLEDEMLQFHTQ